MAIPRSGWIWTYTFINKKQVLKKLVLKLNKYKSISIIHTELTYLDYGIEHIIKIVVNKRTRLSLDKMFDKYNATHYISYQIFRPFTEIRGLKNDNTRAINGTWI